jgi:hypothetical protein
MQGRLTCKEGRTGRGPAEVERRKRCDSSAADSKLLRVFDKVSVAFRQGARNRLGSGDQART